MREFLLGLSPGGYASFFLIVVVAAVLGCVLAWRNWRRARLVEDIPTSKIRSAAQGMVELEGHAVALPGPPVVAPLSQVPCLWYRLVEEEAHRVHHGGLHKTFWHVVEYRESDDLFLIEDETGRCIVDPEGAEVTPSASVTGYGNSLAEARIGAGFLQADRRYTEYRIHEGDPLYVLGEFRTHSTVDEIGLREELSALLRAWKQDPARMREFDANGDGRIDAEEWEAARQAAEAQVLRERAERASQLGAFHVISRPKDGRYPYLLSTEPQDRLTRRLRLWAAAGTAMTVVGSLLAAWMWQLRPPF